MKTKDFIFDPSLVLYLPLYELNGTAFTSKDAQGHPCAATGAIWTPQGRSFDGIDDRIGVGDGGALQLAAQLTMEVWVKPQVHDGFVCGMPYGNTWVPPYWAYMFFYNSDQRFQINWNIGGLGGAGNWLLGSVGASPPDAWYHLAYSFDGNDHVFYKQGVRYLSKNTPGSIAFSGTPQFAIGVDNIDDPSGSFGKGVVGEVRVYNRALTPLEVQHNYLATKWRYQ